MVRPYVIIPAVMMLSFIIYTRSCHNGTSERTYIGDSPLSWKSPSAPGKIAVQATSDPAFERRGSRDARDDLRSGKVVLIEYGPRVAWNKERKEIWTNRYGVELRQLFPFPASAPDEGYVLDYNRVMDSHIVQRFGRDVFTVVEREAMALYERRRAKKG